MTSRYRTAFAVPSGFATATAPAPRVASPAVGRAERKVASASVVSGRPAREPKVEARVKTAAA